MMELVCFFSSSNLSVCCFFRCRESRLSELIQVERLRYHQYKLTLLAYSVITASVASVP